MEQKELENGFKVVTYSGLELSQLSEKEATAIARCYVEVFGQSWGEPWTVESALEEVTKAFWYREERIPVATIIWDGEKAVAFAWGLLTEGKHLIAKRDMPYDLSPEQKEEGLIKARHWLTKVAKVEKVLLYREFGALRQHKGHLAPHLTLEIFLQAREAGYKTLLYWTSVQSRVFDLGIGLKWTPFHFFTPVCNGQDLVLMAGNVSYSYYLAHKAVSGDKAQEEAAYKELQNNIDTYYCR